MRKNALLFTLLSAILVVTSCGGNTAGGDSASAPPTRNEVDIADEWGHYPFDSNGGSISFTDASGNGNDAVVGTIQNTPASTADRIGASNSFALGLDRDNDEGLEVASDAALQATSAMSVSFWLRDGVGNGRVIGQRNGGGANTWEVDVYLSELRYTYAGNVQLKISTGILGSGWNHVVVVMQEVSPFATIYVNGVFQKEDTFQPGGMDLETTNPVRMGRTGQLGADVQLDDVRIYTRALTANEVLTLYNE